MKGYPAYEQAYQNRGTRRAQYRYARRLEVLAQNRFFASALQYTRGDAPYSQVEQDIAILNGATFAAEDARSRYAATFRPVGEELAAENQSTEDGGKNQVPPATKGGPQETPQTPQKKKNTNTPGGKQKPTSSRKPRPGAKVAPAWDLLLRPLGPGEKGGCDD